MSSKNRFDTNTVIGKTFGRLVINKLDHICTDKLNRPIYKMFCTCSCGNTCVVRWKDIRTGATKSCGCLKSEFNKSRSRPPGAAAAHVLYMCYKKEAIKRGYEFLLNEEYFIGLTKKLCFWCGIEPKARYKGSLTVTTPYIYNGVDRVDNTKGYTIENSVPCCKNCNIAKGTMTKENFIEWGIRLGNYLSTKAGE